MLPYPEIYDLSDVETWKRNYLRKELLTQEWDLISNELIPDLFELPFFTAEFCDKWLENLEKENSQSIMIWGHNCEQIEFPTILKDLITNIFRDQMFNCYEHHWKVIFKTWENISFQNYIVRFQKNEDLRARHDSCLITNYIRLDSESVGGELFFPKYDFTLKPKQGVLYFFPGRMTHRYGIKFIKSGVNTSLFVHANH